MVVRVKGPIMAIATPDVAGEGRYVARVRLEGNFPGGTVDLHYGFTLDGEHIWRLQITP